MAIIIRCVDDRFVLVSSFDAGLTAVPAVLQVLTLWRCVESPRYTLIIMANDEQAEKDLRRLRGRGSNVDYELTAMRAIATELRAVDKVKAFLNINHWKQILQRSCISMLVDPVLRWALIISVLMMLSQQFSGINVVRFNLCIDQ